MYTPNQVRETYTRIAQYYDVTHTSPFLKRHEAHLSLEVKAGDRVLEIACGTGLNFPHLRQLIGNSGMLIGLDYTPAMLDIARRRIAGFSWTNVDVVAGDAARLPFPDATLDRVFCSFALSVIPAYEKAIAEVRRVLMPGGRFVALELRPMELPSSSSLFGHLMHRLMGFCAIDTSHQTLKAIQHTFSEVQVRYYLAGMFYMAVSKK
jgi:demethylmenaquinone methyltransferase/2-methoxy-6-polyprenyl-1,4-benzoquinol methylase